MLYIAVTTVVILFARFRTGGAGIRDLPVHLPDTVLGVPRRITTRTCGRVRVSVDKWSIGAKSSTGAINRMLWSDSTPAVEAFDLPIVGGERRQD